MRNIFLIICLLGFSSIYPQDNDVIPLKFRGSKSAGGSIAMVISNRAPFAPEISEVINDLTMRGYRVALVKDDIDIEGLSLKNSPFVKDVLYVMKIFVNNTSTRESVLSLKIDLLVLSSQKKISKEFAAPRANIKMITKEMDALLQQVLPRKDENPLQVLSISNNIFSFTNMARGLRRGDEIRIQYKLPRNKRTESQAIVVQISSNTIQAKDIYKQIEIGDVILPISPKRNRFSFNVHAIVPTIGERRLLASLDNRSWTARSRWPVGFALEGEYERFLPYQLVSTTAFGISVDGVLGTHVFTGIGYRGLVESWEFMPYIRLGFLYNPLGFNSNTGGDPLQGMTLRLGLNLGVNIIKRVSDTIFVGFDLGIRWYFYDFVNVQSAGTQVKPFWNNNQKKFPLSAFYPYIGLKIGWIF
ncbi:MAG: hypothetical protein ACRCV0_01470 [Brevinema sp.]